VEDNAAEAAQPVEPVATSRPAAPGPTGIVPPRIVEQRPVLNEVSLPPPAAPRPDPRTAVVRPIEPTPAPSAGGPQQVQVHVGDGDAPRVNLTITERGGEIHVAVRTPDTQLSAEMRRDLNQLIDRLEQSGYTPETWSPQTGAGGGSADSGSERNDRWESAHREGRDPSRHSADQMSSDSQRRRGRPGWLDVFDNLHGQE
jgi:hypothetical protein